MRLLRCILDGYRSIDFLEFEAGPITVLFGKNNTGKTNVLEATLGVLAPQNMPGRHFLFNGRSCSSRGRSTRRC